MHWQAGSHPRAKAGPPYSEPAFKRLQLSLEEPLKYDDQTDDCKHSPYDSHV
jgi:hypothetical protein